PHYTVPTPQDRDGTKKTKKKTRGGGVVYIKNKREKGHTSSDVRLLLKGAPHIKKKGGWEWGPYPKGEGRGDPPHPT
ncbi:hypothetical protein DVS31_12115, partial [Limosilactobacillus fermentum]|nr:hypothetical protein [Limosilactobacillus fermentum]